MNTLRFSLCLLIALLLGCHQKLEEKELPSFGSVGDFTLTDSYSSSYSLSDSSGRIRLVSFFFSSCPSVCPALNANLKKIEDTFHGNPNLQLLSISVDPDRDTPERLQAYATKFRTAESRWKFLRGPKEEVQRILNNVFHLGSGETPDLHTTRIVLLDSHDEVRGFYNGLDVQEIAGLEADIRHLLALSH